MGLNSVVSAERVHIGFFGMRNAGKSSLVNAFTGQKLSVVSEVKGTTTDPVKKAMELLPLGPVVIIDTPGIDDEGSLGKMRVEKAKEILSKTDIAVLVLDSTQPLSKSDKELLELFESRKIPFVKAYNKADLLSAKKENADNEIFVSALTGEGVELLKNKVASLVGDNKVTKHIVADLLKEGDTVVLVIPIDESAPKGRLILPQQQTIREILEKGCSALCVRDTELEGALKAMAKNPRMVITDSQVFGKVAKLVPEDVELTSFSILFARYKGELEALVKGAEALDNLKDGDRVLISEGCTHHRQCNDIGTVKMPAWIKNYSQKDITFEFTSGGEFPENLKKYALVVHCGGCMLNEREMKSRQENAAAQNIPMVNYGMAIAQMNKIFERSLRVFSKK